MSDPFVTTQPEVGDEVAAAYRENYTLLEYIALRRYRIPNDEVPGVIHDVFIAFIRNLPRIRQHREWLVGATFTQCRLYWRKRNGDSVVCGFEDNFDAAARVRDLDTALALGTVLGQLSSRCRTLLQLRFVEEYSSLEIARRFETTVDYARKLVHRCVLNARALASHRERRREP
jgi:DNA-directed RNA polymerase specialized sigma24 family protein